MRTYPRPAICTECGDEYDRLSFKPAPEGHTRTVEGQCTGCTGQRNAEADRATRQAKERYEAQLKARQKKRRKKKPKDEQPTEGGPGQPGEEPEPWWDH